MRRRRYLALLGGTTLSTALAGCGRRVQSAGPETSSDTPPATSSTATPSHRSDERPVIFVTPQTVERVRARVTAREQPWLRAYRRLLADANRALSATPRSVVDNGAPSGEDDPNRYGSDAPYQEKDGVYSDDIDRHDYRAGLDMGDWARSLAQAYAITRHDRYAAKAIDLLHHWFVDPETRMYPSANNFGPHTEGLKSQNSIEFYIIVPELLYAAALVSGHPHWDEYDSGEEAVREWTRTWQESLLYGSRGGPVGDEIYKWWVTTRMVTAAYLDDRTRLRSAFEAWRTDALADFEPRGSFEYARNRTRGLYYSLSAMNALTYGAEIAHNHGVDLYGYAHEGSESVLRRAHDFHAPFVLDPSSWPWQELDGLDADEREYGVVSYELCYAEWGVDTYRDVVETSSRPIEDRRILGPVTMTHANGYGFGTGASPLVPAINSLITKPHTP